MCLQVIIIQPQIPSSSQASPIPQAEVPTQDVKPAPASPHKPKKKEEDPEVSAIPRNVHVYIQIELKIHFHLTLEHYNRM